jgi:tripartite-type tricarboxylate transporter receptor subunit TctC
MKLVLLAASIALSTGALAQGFPTKPVRIVVAFPPGGATDILARSITPKTGELLGQPVLIENQGGAGGKIGAQQVSRAAPDGHTLLLTVVGSHILNVFLEKGPGNHPIRDYSPVTQAVETVLAIASNPAVGPKSIAEMIETARRNPGQLAYGTTGTETQLAMEQIAQLSGLKLLFVPYKGGAQATTDMLAGTVPMVLQPVVSFLPHVKSGKVRILAVMLPRRWEEMPDVPTVAESVPGFQKSVGGIGIWGPAGVPPAVTSRLQSARAGSLRQPEVSEKLRPNGMIVVASTPGAFAADIQSSFTLYERLVKSAGLKPQ